MNFNDVAIVSIKGNYYRIPFWYISKDKAIILMTNSNFINFFSPYIKRWQKQLIIKKIEILY